MPPHPSASRSRLAFLSALAAAAGTGPVTLHLHDKTVVTAAELAAVRADGTLVVRHLQTALGTVSAACVRGRDVVTFEVALAL